MVLVRHVVANWSGIVVRLHHEGGRTVRISTIWSGGHLLQLLLVLNAWATLRCSRRVGASAELVATSYRLGLRLRIRSKRRAPCISMEGYDHPRSCLLQALKGVVRLVGPLHGTASMH